MYYSHLASGACTRPSGSLGTSYGLGGPRSSSPKRPPSPAWGCRISHGLFWFLVDRFLSSPIGTSSFHRRRGTTSRNRPLFLRLAFMLFDLISTAFQIFSLPNEFPPSTTVLVGKGLPDHKVCHTHRLLNLHRAWGGGGAGGENLQMLFEGLPYGGPHGGGVQLSQQLSANHQSFFQAQDPSSH